MNICSCTIIFQMANITCKLFMNDIPFGIFLSQKMRIIWLLYAKALKCFAENCRSPPMQNNIEINFGQVNNIRFNQWCVWCIAYLFILFTQQSTTKRGFWICKTIVGGDCVGQFYVCCALNCCCCYLIFIIHHCQFRLHVLLVAVVHFFMESYQSYCYAVHNMNLYGFIHCLYVINRI